MKKSRKNIFYNDPNILVEDLKNYDLEFISEKEQKRFDIEIIRKHKMFKIWIIITPQQLKNIKYKLLNDEDFTNKPMIVVDENDQTSTPPKIFMLRRV